MYPIGAWIKCNIHRVDDYKRNQKESSVMNSNTTQIILKIRWENVIYEKSEFERFRC